MATLASIADYETITGETVPAAPNAQRTRIEGLIALASEAVLAGAHGQLIEQATYTAVTLNTHDGIAYLPQRPVTAIASVVVDGITLAPTDYRWTPGGFGQPALLIRQVDGLDARWTSRPIATFTAGWSPVHGQIRAAIVSMVVSSMEVGGGSPATQHSETAGPFTVQDSYVGVEQQQANLALTASTQAVLDRLCGLRGRGGAHIDRDQP